MTYKGEKTIARGYAKHSNELGMCLREIRLLFGIGPKYSSAASAWRNAKHRHSGGRRGYPCFWQGGSQGFGHIALDIGNGYCISSDAPNLGARHMGVVKKSTISAAWNMTYAGYTTDLNGVSVWVPTVDWSKLNYASRGHPTSYPYGVKVVEHALDLHGLLASKYVNGYWDGPPGTSHTGDAWKRLCHELGVTVSAYPTLGSLRALGRTGNGRLIAVG